MLLNFEKQIVWFAVLFLVGLSPAEAYNDRLGLPAAKVEMAVKDLLLDIELLPQRSIIVGSRGHIFYKKNYAADWEQANVNSQAHLTAVHFLNEGTGWAVGEVGAVLKTTDKGKNWSLISDQRENSANDMFLDVLFLDDKTGFVVGTYGAFYQTSDGGHSWVDIRQRIDNEDEWHLMSIAVDSDGNLFITGEKGKVFRSTDGGQHWVSLSLDYEGTLFGILPFKLNEENKLLLYGVAGALFYSNDIGQNWNLINSSSQVGLFDASQSGENTILIVGAEGTLLELDAETFSVKQKFTETRLPLNAVVCQQGVNCLAVGMGGVHPITLNHDLTN